MTAKERLFFAYKNLYQRGKVTREGLLKAVADGTITQEEYTEIVGVGEETHN